MAAAYSESTGISSPSVLVCATLHELWRRRSFATTRAAPDGAVEGDGAPARLLAAVAPGAEPRLGGRPTRRERMAAVVGEEPAPEELLKPEACGGASEPSRSAPRNSTNRRLRLLSKRVTTAAAGAGRPSPARIDRRAPRRSSAGPRGGIGVVPAPGRRASGPHPPRSSRRCGQAGRLRALEFAQGRLDRLAQAAESVVPAVGLGPDGRELRHDGVGGGLAALSLLTLHLRGLA